MSQTGTTNWSSATLPISVYDNSTVTNGSYIYSIGGMSNISYTYGHWVYSWRQVPTYNYVYSCRWVPYWYYSPWSPYLQWGGYYQICSWQWQLTWVWTYSGQWVQQTYYYNGPTNNVYVASLSNLGSWNQTSSLPQNIYHASSVEYNNNIFVFGGRNYYGATMNTIYEATIGSGGGTNSIYVYNLANISLPPQQGSFSGSIYDEGLGILQDPGNTTVNYLYAFGGILNGGTSQSTYYTT